MEWKTRVTELLGCKYPILQGAMMGLGDWKLAAAVAQAGACGMITASVCRTPERLRDDIRKCRDAIKGSKGSFGVNISGIYSIVDAMIDVCIEEKVIVETAAYKPDDWAPRIKGAGLTWINKSARVKDALHAEKLGADAVIVVGMEGIGFKNPEQLTTMLTLIWAKRELKIPFIASGGIGDARGFLSALAAGADGVMMGTAFMATSECRLSTAAKEALVKARPDDPQIRHRVLSTPDPEAVAAVMEMRDKVPLEKWMRMVEAVNLKEPNWEKAEVGKRELSASLAVGVIDRIQSVQELIDGIVNGAEELLNSYDYIKAFKTRG